MQISVQTLIRYLEQLAPQRLAYDWDNVGLQLGSSHGVVRKILVALDVDESVLFEAIGMGADFIVTHHPFIFRPISAIRTDLPQGRLIEKALQSGIRIYAAHTNLDVAQGGVNDVLAEIFGLTDTDILRRSGQEDYEKLVVFVPQEHTDNVRNALAAAGAGWIGNYSHCTFSAPGTGTFMPREGANPYAGKLGKLEKAQEVRLETILPATLRNQVVRAMMKAHPYEEVAYDLYPLITGGKPYGIGRVGKIQEPCSLQELCNLVKEKLQVGSLHVAGAMTRTIKKVAVCGGSGGDLIHAASFAGADVLITGDLKYHEARDAQAVNLSVIDAGHDATERVIVPVLCRYLRQSLHSDGCQAEVIASKVDTAPWRAV